MDDAIDEWCLQDSDAQFDEIVPDDERDDLCLREGYPNTKDARGEGEGDDDEDDCIDELAGQR